MLKSLHIFVDEGFDKKVIVGNEGQCRVIGIYFLFFFEKFMAFIQSQRHDMSIGFNEFRAEHKTVISGPAQKAKGQNTDEKDTAHIPQNKKTPECKVLRGN